MSFAQFKSLLQLLTQYAALNETQICYGVQVNVLVQVLPACELVLEKFYAARSTGVQIGPYEVQSDAQGLQLSHGIGGKIYPGIQQLHVQERMRTEFGQKSSSPLAHAVLPEIPVVDNTSGYQLHLHIHAAVAVVTTTKGAHSKGI